MKPTVPGNEFQRLAALHEAGILDTPREDAFDDLAAMASRICEAPIALVGLVDEDRQWFKSVVGWSRTQIPRDAAFCAHTILRPDLLVVPDATLDPRFADNPLVTSDPHVRFYAGAPLVTSDGYSLGALCVMDCRVRSLSADQQTALLVLGRHAVALLELRRLAEDVSERNRAEQETERLTTSLREQIAERERAQRAVQESERRFRALVENAFEGTVIFREDGTFSYASPGVQEVSGYEAGALVGHRWDEFVHPEDLAAAGAFFARIAGDPAARGIVEFRVGRNRGSWRWLEAAAANRLADPAVRGIVANFRDITERKRAAAALEESEDRYRDLVEHSQDLICTHDLDGVLLSINPWAAKTLGYQPAELLGTNVRGVLAPEVRHEFDDYVATIRSEGAARGLMLMQTRSGERRVWEYRNTLRTEGVTAPVVRGIAHDITERTRAERELRHKAAELERTGQHLEHAQATALLGSWEMDPAGGSFWSAEMYRLFSRDPGAGPPTIEEFLELVHPDDRATLRETQGRVGSAETVRVVVRTNPACGPVRYLEASSVRLPRRGRMVQVGTTQDVTERVQLVERERRAREVAETLAQANLALAQEAPLEAVLETILDQVARLVSYDSGSVLLLEEGRRLAVRAARGYARWTDADTADHIVFDPATSPIHDAILASGEPFLVRDSVEEPRWQRVAGAEHVRSWLGVPLVQQGRTIALFSLDKAEPNFFTTEHVRLAQALAPAAATAIANAQLLADLRDEESRLRLAIAAADVGLFDWDLRSNRVHYSTKWKQQIGYEDHEIADDFEEWRSRCHPDDLPRVLEVVGRFVRTPWPDYEIEFRFRHRDGSYRWILTRADVLRGADGEPERMLGCHIDITERKAAERALRDSEERLRLFVRHAPAAIAMFDTEMRYIAVSDRWLADYGLGTAAVIGRSHYDVFPEIPERWRGIHQRVLAGASERAEEDRFERADGSVDWVRWEMLPWRNAEGAVGGAMLFSEVVTERVDLLERERAARAAADASGRLLRDLLDGLGPSMFVGLLTVDGTLVEANRPALAAAGLKATDVLGRPFPETHWWSYSEEVQRRLREAIARGAAGESSRYDERVRGAGDSLLTVDFSIEPLFDRAGRVRYLVPSAREITDRTRAEVALRESEEGLRTLSRRLLSAQEEERRRLARELHDQVGQVLTAVKLNLEGLGRQTTLEAAIARVPRATAIIDVAIQQVRDLSLDLRPSLLDDLGLPAALRWYVDRQVRDAEIRGHVAAEGIDVRLPHEIETACFRVAQEAVTNVLRHARAKNVQVALRRVGVDLELRVCDDGAGFDPAEARARAASGACMGLAGMEERVSLAGGSLEVTSAPGAGTQIVALFTVSPGAVP